MPKTKTRLTTLSDVKLSQPDWFSRRNKKFFNDINYRVLHGKVSGKPFLVRSTYAWSDAFGQPQRMSWIINPLSDDLKIQSMIDKHFGTLDNVKDHLKFF